MNRVLGIVTLFLAAWLGSQFVYIQKSRAIEIEKALAQIEQTDPSVSSFVNEWTNVVLVIPGETSYAILPGITLLAEPMPGRAWCMVLAHEARHHYQHAHSEWWSDLLLDEMGDTQANLRTEIDANELAFKVKGCEAK